jgi:hypothetical protein
MRDGITGAGWFRLGTCTLTAVTPEEMIRVPDGGPVAGNCRIRASDPAWVAAGTLKSGTVQVCGALAGSGKDEGRMGGIRLLTTLYTIFFVLIILIVIGSFFGVFNNPLIDPGL